ncbi:putative disease resistance protein RGA1 [Silene latifolia]|uniref:putative disease resistance protein RGA1 n=1 Tax=Silene latifolia TaxID=37657 RepID=UPI003D7845FC
MATGVVITVAEKLFTVLTSQEFKEICSTFGYESQLDELADTVSTIKAVLFDADLKHQELTHGGREYIEKLKDAVYDVDDVLDEFNTMVLKAKKKNGGKTLKKMRRFFSRTNQFLVAFNMSREIKKLREKLDNIAKNRQQFGFSDVFVPPKQRKETGSYAREDSIIGRESDKAAIVGLLLDKSDPQPNVEENVTFATIVGMGGLGKTALAQLAYNDEEVKDEFKVRLWVCVSNEFGMEQIFAKMIGKNAGIGMEELQREVRKVIERRKYLLVLDDVWCENHNKWVELRDFLMLGGKGSRVLITSRSKAVARAINNNHTHELQGLSDECSWRLFKKMAFETGKSPLDHELVDIGKEVVKKCANVPLSIRVVGSLLYGQHKSKWLSFKSIDLRNLGSSEDGQAEDGIMPILKYSYYNLSPSLKSCFSYCALFPKDFEIRKRTLIWLWMAHGCLDLLNDGRSIEDVGDEYFSILLHRCFFQEVKEDDYGNIDTCKMHDLIHDLAQEVAGEDLFALETATFQFEQKIRHLSISNDGCKLLTRSGDRLGEMKKLRSLCHIYYYSFHPIANNEANVDIICSNLRRLRVLDFSFPRLKNLPNSIGDLSHLRYLDLSSNYSLKILPESITKLQNLQVLNLAYSGVRELPKGLRNLHNLRHLVLNNCTKLTHMPVGMDTMTGLMALSKFVVASKTCKHGKTGRLEDLRSLMHLTGTLEIIFKSGFCSELANDREGLLRDKVHLQNIVIRWEEDPDKECSLGAVHEKLLEGLRPHCNIKGIEISGYKGIKIPSWVGSLATFFPCLIRVTLRGFDWLCNLHSLGKLVHLKVLQLSCMPMVELTESDDNTTVSDTMSTVPDGLPLFRSLEKLLLKRLPKLNGIASVRLLPRLHRLVIEDCPSMTVVPRCPSLNDLHLVGVNEDFRFTSNRKVDPSSSSLTPLDLLPHRNDDSSCDSTFYLKSLLIDKVGLVNLIFGESLKGIETLSIRGLNQESLSTAADLFQKHASSIRDLQVTYCRGLKSLCGGGIEHLTNLRYLCISDSDELDLGKLEELKPLKNLSHLTLVALSKLIHLPEGIRHLSTLRTLAIYNCKLESLPEWLSSLPSLYSLQLHYCTELKSLPEAIRHMPSLRELQVWNCKGLTDRCREPNGQDWPKISHIHSLSIVANYD